MLRNIHATNLLKEELGKNMPFNFNNVDNVMDLIRRYNADPDVKADTGLSLLHILAMSFKHNQVIEELVNKYYADIDIQDAKGHTPLQCVINDPKFFYGTAMSLILLGANPHVKNDRNETFLQILSRDYAEGAQLNCKIKELDKLIIEYDKKHRQARRSDFLVLLIMLSCDYSNKSSNSYFKTLPIEIISTIVSLIDVDKMGKTQQECSALAFTMLYQSEKIKKMIKMPGGINVFQNIDADNRSGFVFFKSVHKFCNDYQKFKNDIEKENYDTPLFAEYNAKKQEAFKEIQKSRLEQFTEQYAIPYWIEHSSLYVKQKNRKRLFEDIENSEPYNNQKIQSNMKV